MRRQATLMGLAAVLALAMAAAPANGDFVVAADRLVAQQAGDGSWAGEEMYTGSIVPGLVQAYEMTGTTAYKTAADSGGSYILATAGGNFYGDEAYALTRLSDISADPASNSWRTSVSDFYTAVESYTGGGGGTSGYISFYGAVEPSTAAFYLGHHVVAAYYVDANDKVVWRDGLIDYLGDVDDSTADYPVMGLGVSVWALAQTGPLDGTLVDPSAPSGSTWDGVALQDLPDMLLSHQKSSGDHAGSFYWQFGHLSPPDPCYGYTDDTVFGTLGLMAADSAGSGDYSQPISLGRREASLGVDSDGRVYDHLWLGAIDRHYFAGDALRLMIPEPATLSLLGFSSLVLWVRRRRRG